MQLNNRHINTLLALVAVVMAALCVASVYSPLRFADERSERELVVKERLVAIRQAQADYLARHGRFAPSLDSLGVADSLKEIPFSGGRRFELRTTVATLKSGKRQPLMECGARYDDYLRGLDRGETARLSAQAAAQGRFPGLKIGDLKAPNENAGNWE